MKLSSQCVQGFQTLARQDEDAFNLADATLLISKVLQPSLRLDAYRDKIQSLSDNLKERYVGLSLYNPPLQAKVDALQSVMCKEGGFHGEEDAYDDLDHMNMARLLDSTCGTALNLSLLYVQCAQACGWSAHALNFPGYCLISIEDGAKRAVLDPFEQCVELDAYTLRQMIKVLGGAEAELQPIFYERLSNKTLFMRHLGAIKAHFLRCQQVEQALEVLEACTILEPASAAYWRETGLLEARIGQIEAAVSALRTALKFTGDADAIRHTQRILTDLERKLD